MKTSGRVYCDRYKYLLSRVDTLSKMVRSSEKDAIDANWGDAGTVDYISKLVDRALAEFDGG